MGLSTASARNLAGLSDAEQQPPRPFRSHELAARWGVPEQAVTAVLRSGRLRGFKLQKIWLIPRQNVEAFERGEQAA